MRRRPSSAGSSETCTTERRPRLVVLGMSIGLAEQKLATDPEFARELLAETRKGMQEALEELRDLARGIHPQGAHRPRAKAVQRRSKQSCHACRDRRGPRLLRDGLTRLLRDKGFDVAATVTDGDALIDAVSREQPDVAIVDIRLP